MNAVEHDFDHQRPVRGVDIGSTEGGRGDEQIGEPLREGDLEMRAAQQECHRERQRHAEHERRTDAAEAGDGEPADREEHGNAKKSVLGEGGKIWKGDLRHAVGCRPPEPVMIEDDRRYCCQAQQIEPGHARGILTRF
jgi:hypothetical protein